MSALSASVAEVATETQFSGVVRVDLEGATATERAFGAANRTHGVPNTVATRFGVASATKGLTALTVMSLVHDGALALTTTARSLLGRELPLVDDRVTVEHLLAHRSGIGDYLDEAAGGDILDYAMVLPVHLLDRPEAYLPVLDGHTQQFEPGTAFAYCNSGYVLLALLAERAGGAPFAELVQQRVCGPSGMHDTAFLRGDEPDASAAVGYLHAQGRRTNVLHLPVCGSGDGGIFSTVADLHRLWAALGTDSVLPAATIRQMLHPHTPPVKDGDGYGLGFWLRPGGAVALEGYDPGVSCTTVHDPGRGITWTVLSNSTDGAWPIVRRLHALLGT